jgi:hypothetical protein
VGLPAANAVSDYTNQSHSDLSPTNLRYALIKRLRDEEAPDLYERLEGCGQEIPLTCTHCGGASLATTHCKARYCPECRPIITMERVARWRSAIATMQWPLFMTLTIPNSEDPERLRFLRKKWSAFRRRKLIRERIRGGVATIEITNIGNGWHPHLHAIADCRWLALNTKEPHYRDSQEIKQDKYRMAKAELSTLWADQIGEDNGIVQAKRLRPDDPGYYILKYAAKCTDLLDSPDPIAPMLRVMRTTRTISGWGHLHPLPSPDADTGAECKCGECGATKSLLPNHVLQWVTRSHNYCDPRPALPANSYRS